jgi:hypothetical protein
VRKRWGWTKVLKALRIHKKDIDFADAAMAKRKYSEIEEFSEYFSYRKGNKRIPLKSTAHIARKFRMLEGTPRFWDYIEEDEELEEINQS